MQSRKYFLGLIIVLIMIPALATAAEQLTITTYYPSPNGSYDQLATNKLAVDVTNVAVPAEYTAMATGDAHIGRGLIVGSSAGYFFQSANPGDGGILCKGPVGINTTIPQYTLDVNGNFRSTGNAVYLTGLPPGGFPETLSVDGVGRVYKAGSSLRYKHDIRDYSFDLNKINDLRPVRFKWNADTATPNVDDFGLIAEEVYKVFPELVGLNKGGKPEAVKYERIGVVLVKTVQELNKKVQAQQEELARLKQELKAIKETRR